MYSTELLQLPCQEFDKAMQIVVTQHLASWLRLMLGPVRQLLSPLLLYRHHAIRCCSGCSTALPAALLAAQAQPHFAALCIPVLIAGNWLFTALMNSDTHQVLAATCI
jgi:hypothetical protein